MRTLNYIRSVSTNVWVAIGTMIAAAAGVTYCSISREQLSASNNQFRDSQRAYINFKGFQLQTATYENWVRVVVQAILENDGNTPTLNAYGAAGCAWVNPVHEDCDFVKICKLTRDPTATRFLLGAHGQTQIETCSLLDYKGKPTDMSSASTPIGGLVEYRDRIKPNELHQTEFCLKMVSVAPSENPPTANWIPIGEHNCADNECPPD